MDTITVLKNLGLSEAESHIYVLLLGMGESKAGRIIKQAPVSSSNVHEALERLSFKGLVAHTKKNSIKHYRALPPEYLEQILAKEKRELHEKEEHMHELISQLTALQETITPDTDVEIFFGEGGLRSAHKKLLTDKEPGSDFCFFFENNPEVSAVVHKFFGKLDQENMYNDLSLRSISGTEQVEGFTKRNAPFAIRYTSRALPAHLSFYKNKTLIISWGGTPTGILITSKEITDGFRKYFNAMWEELA